MALVPPDPQALVIFGASGDLTSRKIMPAVFRLFKEGLAPDKFAVIGYARSEMTDESFRNAMKAAVATAAPGEFDALTWDSFASKIRYVAGEFSSEGAMHHLVDHLDQADTSFGCEGRRLFYCATPPQAFPLIAQRLGETGLSKGSKVVVEKPFGVDLSSAQELNRVLHDSFDESQIFRIDHYLGKETVQNILVFRFSNGMFEPIWNRRYVAYVEIEVAESLGVEGRGGFYEGAGAIKDVAQNHLMQVLALLAMEPPASFDAEALRDEKVKLLRSVPICDPSAVVRGQYGPGEISGESVAGYLQEPDVAADSTTETFVAMRLTVENWRWAGVPFYIRTGKRLPRRTTSATIVFHDAPHMIFNESGLAAPEANHITLRFQPDEGISLTFDAKKPGPEMAVSPVKMDFDYGESFMTTPAEAYERLIHDAMEGDRTLFMRADEIERAWQIIEPALEPSAPETYAAGSWGPEGARRLIEPGRWHTGD